MRIKQYTNSLTAGLAFSFFSVTAQTAVTLEECQREALAYNKSLDISRMDLTYAETAIKAARTAYFPKVDGSASALFLPDLEGISIAGFTLPTTEEAQAGNFSGTSGVDVPGFDLGMSDLQLYMAGISVEQPLFTGGRIRLSNQMAERSADIAREAVNLSRAEVLHATNRAFWSLLAVQEQVKVLINHEAALDSLEEELRTQYELGILPRSEMLKVSVQRNEAKLRLVEANNLLDLTGMNLASLTGRDLDERLKAVAVSDSPFESLMRLAVREDFSHRPELQILNQQHEIARLERLSLKGEYLPQVGLNMKYNYLHVPDLVSGNWNLTLGAGVSIPLVHWREKKHRTDMAKIDVLKSEKKLADTHDQIAMEVRQNRQNMEAGSKKIEVAQANLIQAEETLSEIEISFNNGLNTITDLLNARVAHQRAAATLVEARANLEILKSAYLKSLGLL